MIIQGRVIAGQNMASSFGIATANLEISSKSLPEEAVYIVNCVWNKQKFRGILHFGKRKTVDNKFSAEVHLFDFSQDVYGEELKIEILQKLREIKKFPSIEKLFSQIRIDIIQVKKYFLRLEIKDKWLNLDDKSREILDQKALEKVSQNKDFLQSQNIYLYAPKADEINFVPHLCEKFADKKYFFPKIVGQEIRFFAAKFSELKAGKWGILEPNDNLDKTVGIPDLIFVPAVGANLAGNRLGNGGGFYDRFLQQNPAKKICVLPDFAIFEEIPTEKHDISIDEVLIV